MCIVMGVVWDKILIYDFFFRCCPGLYIRPPQYAGNIQLTLKTVIRRHGGKQIQRAFFIAFLIRTGLTSTCKTQVGACLLKSRLNFCLTYYAQQPYAQQPNGYYKPE